MRRKSGELGQMVLGVALTAMTVLGAVAPVVSHADPSIMERWGSRAPRTCANQQAPARGAITAAAATQYFICKSEYISGTNLYLVENVRLQVGGPVPYTPNLGSFHGINVRVPLYPIRGSYRQYSCRNQLTEYSGPPGTNCAVYEHVNARGYCYKDPFGDWSCFMNDPYAQPRHGQAPPR